jgi:hypothetical protein
MKSIIQKDNTHCFLCGRNGSAEYWGLDKHHIYFGGLRSKSEKYGLTVYLCHERCHLGGVHKNAEVNRQLQAYAQKKAMEHYGWSVEDFRREFYKNYL